MVRVADALEQVAQDHEVRCARADDRAHAHAAGCQIARERIERAGAEPSADEHHVTFVGQRRGPAERADEVEHLVALVERAEEPGRLADLLDDERDRAGVGVEVGQADRHALAVHIDTEDHELSRLRVVGDQRRVDDEERRDRGQLAFLEDDRHHIS